LLSAIEQGVAPIGASAVVIWSGLRIWDYIDPYNPVEIGRFHRARADFEAKNGDIQDV
jgi:hypothetical protein